MKNIFLIYLLHIFFSLLIKAQTPVYRNYSVTDGLPSSEIFHVMQDSKGYIWFATNAGVSRFNGYDFRNFDISDGLPDNTVFEIYEDFKGRIWFIPFSCKLSYFYNDSIHIFKYNDKLQKKLTSPNPVKMSFYIDSNETIYIGIYGHPVMVVSKKGKLSELPHYDVSNSIVNIHIIKNQKAILSSHGNFNNNIVVNSGKKRYKVKALPLISGRRMAVLNNQNELLYTEGMQLMWLKDSVTYKIKKFSKEIIWLQTDNLNNLWIGFYNGGVDFYKNGDVFQTEPLHYLNQLSVSSVFPDQEGGLWFTTLTDGVFYLSNSLFTSYTINDGLPSKKVNCILPLSDKLWVGCNTNYLSCISLNRIKNYEIPDVIKSEIVTIFNDSTNAILWFSTYHSLYYIKNKKLHTLNERIITDDLIKCPAGKIQFNQILKSKNNILWLGSSKGLYSVVNNTLYLHNQNISDKIRVSALDEDKEGNIWICNNEGTWVYTPKGENGFDGSIRFLGEKYPLLKNRITAISIDKKNNRFFFGTKGAGLLIMKNDTVMQLLKKDGLLSNSITSICVNDNEIWAGTNLGLNRITFKNFSKKKFTINDYTESHGLISNEITQVKTYDSKVYVATNKGLTIFDYKKTITNLRPPPVYIEKIQVLDKDTLLINNFDLTYNQNSVSFYFVGLTYRKAGNVVYKYRLDQNGAVGNWVMQDHNVARFSFLSPGNYTFHVTAKNEDGIWNKKPVFVNFKIIPPYWKTWWFQLLIFLIAIFLISFVFLLIYRIRINEARKRIKLKREEIKKRNILLRDLNKYKQQVLNKQMNPHFIFNSLNSIQRYILKNDRIKSNLYLTKFATLMRVILNNSMQNLILIKDDLEALNLYLELEALRFEGRFEYTIDVKDENILTCKIPPLFIQPFVENSIWHGLMPKNDKGKININFIYLNHKEILCTITDDGIGRKASEALKNELRKDHKSLGTNLTSARLSVLNSLYNTSMKIEFLDIENNNGTPSGTQVNVIIPVIKNENEEEL